MINGRLKYVWFHLLIPQLSKSDEFIKADKEDWEWNIPDDPLIDFVESLLILKFED